MNTIRVLSDGREIDRFQTNKDGPLLDLWLAHAGYETLEGAARANFVSPLSIGFDLE